MLFSEMQTSNLKKKIHNGSNLPVSQVPGKSDSTIMLQFPDTYRLKNIFAEQEKEAVSRGTGTSRVSFTQSSLLHSSSSILLGFKLKTTAFREIFNILLLKQPR